VATGGLSETATFLASGLSVVVTFFTQLLQCMPEIDSSVVFSEYFILTNLHNKAFSLYQLR